MGSPSEGMRIESKRASAREKLLYFFLLTESMVLTLAGIWSTCRSTSACAYLVVMIWLTCRVPNAAVISRRRAATDLRGVIHGRGEDTADVRARCDEGERLDWTSPLLLGPIPAAGWAAPDGVHHIQCADCPWQHLGSRWHSPVD